MEDQERGVTPSLGQQIQVQQDQINTVLSLLTETQAELAANRQLIIEEIKERRAGQAEHDGRLTALEQRNAELEQRQDQLQQQLDQARNELGELSRRPPPPTSPAPSTAAQPPKKWWQKKLHEL